MPHGELDVYVEGAVGIKDTALIGKGSPYCTLTMGTQSYSSPPVEEGGTHPYFNTRFEFQVDRSTQQLMVAIYSKKSLTEDDLLGYCTIFFRDAFYHSHVVPVTPYALTRPSGRPGGHIRLSLTFKSQPRQPAPAPGGYAPPQPAPYRRARPLGPPPGPYARGPPPPGQYGQTRRPQAGPFQALYPPQSPYPSQAPYAPQAPYPPRAAYPPQQPQYPEPRRMNEESESNSESSDSGSDDDGPPGPYKPQPQIQPATRGRGRVGPPPGRGGPRPGRPGPSMNQAVGGPAPQQPGNNNIMGSVLQNLGGMLVGAAVGSMLGSDGDGSDWGGGDDVSVNGSFGNVESETYGTLEDGYYEEAGTVVEVQSYENYESYEERDVSGESSYQGAAGAPGGGYQPVGYAPPGPGDRGRGRAGPPQDHAHGGPPGRGRAGPRGRAPMRGRGPIARGGPPPMRGRGPPAGY